MEPNLTKDGGGDLSYLSARADYGNFPKDVLEEIRDEAPSRGTVESWWYCIKGCQEMTNYLTIS